MLNRFFKLLRIGTLGVLVLFFIGCDELSSTSEVPSISPTKQPTYSYLNIQELNDANITIFRVKDKRFAYTAEVAEDGSFVVDINDSFEDEDLMSIEVNNLNIISYVTLNDLRQKGIVINSLSTLASLDIKSTDSNLEIIQKLSDYSNKLFRISFNDDENIDYKDLNSFISNPNGEKLINPKILEQFESSGFISAIVNNEDLVSFKNLDSDSDGLSWEEEILIGSDINKVDSDSDGIEDSDELQLGLNPTNSDSDFDTISDFDELNGVTDPGKSDSDGDYLSDSYELLKGSNPLEGDENSNGILDGLEGDPLFKYQWHLQSNGDIVSNTNNKVTIVGNDLDILNVYMYQRGDESTIIQVVDTGVELAHEDLNVDTDYSRNSINGTNDPTPTKEVSNYNKASPFEVGHGTAVAGIVGAIAQNGVGLRGVIPNATIAGSNWLEEQSIEELDRLWYNSVNANDILVSNNSWGSYMSKDKSFEDIMRLASEELRDGKGRVFTFASGNDREIYGNANLSYIANNRYAITVASLNHENRYSYYSNPGSNILVSAYGGSSYELGPTIATTLLSGESYYESELSTTLGAITFDEDSSRSYTFTMNGTSASTPMVSGALGLVLTSCPELTWRDVRWLLSYKSKKIDIDDENWVKNSARRSHNINYGYGLIDTDAMIQECRSSYYTLLPQEISAETSRENINVYIPDNNLSKSISLDIEEDFTLEWLELTVDSNHPYAGDYEINLISPYGTKTQIIAPNELRSDYYKGGFRFSSAAFMGEKTKGVWIVEVVDRLKLDSGTITSLRLKIYGHER